MWYRTGTVSLATGSKRVVGVGTDFIRNLKPGFIFITPDDALCEVGTIVSAAEFDLVTPYAGPTVAGASYAAAPTQSYIVDLTTRCAELLDTFSAFRDAYNAGDLVGAGLNLKGVLAAPSELPTEHAEGDAYLVGFEIYVWTAGGWQHSSLGNAVAAVEAADTATAKASEAAASAAAALDHENLAAISAGNAAESEGLAADSATVATGAAASLAAGLAAFRKLYLGSFEVDPAVDGNGDPLAEGAEYFNTVSNKLRTYVEGAWQDYDETAQAATNNANLSALSAASSASTATTKAQEVADSVGLALAAKNAAETAQGIAATKAEAAETFAGAAFASKEAAAISAQSAADDAARAEAAAAAAADPQVNADFDAELPSKAAILNRPTAATPLKDGLFSKEDKSKLDGVAAGANVTRDGAEALSNKTLQAPVITDYTETRHAPAAGNAFAVDLANGTLQRFTTTANTSIALPAAVDGKSYTLIVKYGGNHSVAFTGGTTLKWADGSTPKATSVAGKKDIYVFTCDEGETLGRSGGSNF